MTLLFILIGVVFAALLLVSIVNKAQQRERARRMQQRQLRLRVELLEEVLDSLAQTLPNRLIAKHVNDEIIDLLQEILSLEKVSPQHLASSIKSAASRGEELSNTKRRNRTSYLKESDAQIAQTQHHLGIATQVLRHQYHLGRINDEEINAYQGELEWANLMVSVVSYIGQGYKASSRGDIFSAQAFYKRAQLLLIDSMHPNPKRMQMIKELGETIAGTRATLSEDLMPEESTSLADG